MDRYQLVLARLEQEEAEQWKQLLILIEEADTYGNDKEFIELKKQLERYQLARTLLLEARQIGDQINVPDAAECQANKEAE